MRQLAQQPFQGRYLAGRQIQWVYPYRAIDIGILLAQGLHRAGVLGAYTDAQEMPYAPFTGSLQGGIEGALVGAQVKTVEVAMGVYEHGIRHM
ncbi:hypothetical protein GCM10011247_13560 [Pseudomonas plecoglossicida]|nr:hypothetical protein GCM10011247_13560 [Pseudomonas plecoglossicida]